MSLISSFILSVSSRPSLNVLVSHTCLTTLLNISPVANNVASLLIAIELLHAIFLK